MERSQEENEREPNLLPQLGQLVERAVSSVVFIIVFEPSNGGHRPVGSGSGFCWKTDRGETLIITNRHVVSDEPDGRYTVSFGEKGGSRFAAELVGRHPLADIAVLRAPIAPRPSLLAFRKGLILPGEDVIAVGNPQGYTTSFSRGIISATDREDFTGPFKRPVRSIQTDATINVGNSGGPLMALDQSVVGVNSHGFFAPSNRVWPVQENQADDGEDPVVLNEKGNPLYVHPVLEIQGVNFAVPADIAEAAANAVIESTGKGVAVGRLGIEYDRQYWEDREGSRAVTRVADLAIGVRVLKDPPEGSPACIVGIQERDMIVSIDDEPVDHPADLTAWSIKPESWGREVPLRFIRDGVMREVVVTGERHWMKE